MCECVYVCMYECILSNIINVAICLSLRLLSVTWIGRYRFYPLGMAKEYFILSGCENPFTRTSYEFRSPSLDLTRGSHTTLLLRLDCATALINQIILDYRENVGIIRWHLFYCSFFGRLRYADCSRIM